MAGGGLALHQTIPTGRSAVPAVSFAQQLRQRRRGQAELLRSWKPDRLREKKSASQQDIWRELRDQAYVGLCDCEWMQKQFQPAGEDCQRALSYVKDDPYANYRLGMVYAEEYNQAGNKELLKEARQHFNAVIQVNPDTAEAAHSRTYLTNIDAVLPQ